MSGPAPRELKRLPAPFYTIAKQRRIADTTPDEQRWDAYLIPGTTTLRNLLGSSPSSYGTTDAAKLARVETLLSMQQVVRLDAAPIAGDFDLDHMKRIHKALFEDIYPWAGETSSMLERHDHLRGITEQAEFAGKLAFVWGKINTGGSALSE